MNIINSIKPSVLMFIFGLPGVISLILLVPEMLALQPEPLSFSISIIQLISTVQSSVLLLVMVWLGAVFSKKVGLSAPVIFALAHSENAFKELRPQIIPALAGGIIGGIFVVIFITVLSGYLPSEFLSSAEKFTPPWYTKILYGGITEEILIRWGLMSFFTWGIYRLSQKGDSEIRNHNYVIAIIVSSLIFGVGHLPAVFALSSEITATVVAYIILGNSAFGFIAGYLYWKRGLECAIGAHMIAHVTMIFGKTWLN